MEAVYDTTSKKWVITKGAPEEIGKAYYDNESKKWILSNQTQTSLLENIEKEMKKLNYEFIKPPILIGGGAMEYYGMRKTGHDYDFMISIEDCNKLKSMGKHLNTFGGTEIDSDGLSTDMTHLFFDQWFRNRFSSHHVSIQV